MLQPELSYKIYTEFKYLISILVSMCEMIDEIEIEHLKMALARARKEMHEESVEETPLVAIAN